MAMPGVAPRLTVGSYVADRTKNPCDLPERSEFNESC